MSRCCHPVVYRRVTLLLLAFLAGGCEIEGEGGGDRVRWEASSLVREPEDRPNPDAELVHVSDDATVSVRP